METKKKMNRHKSASKKRKKSRGIDSSKLPVLVVILLLVVLLLGGIVAHIIAKYTPSKKMMDLYEYYGQPEGEEAAIIIGSEILEERGIQEGEEVYLPIDVVNRYLNQRYYWDQESAQILYATPSELQSYLIEGSTDLIQQNETVYLSISFIQNHTDMEVTTAMNPARVAIQNQFSDLNIVTVYQDTQVRYLGGIKADILTGVHSGTQLLLLEELENWDHVATMDGYIGYVEKKHVGKPETISMERSFAEEEYRYLSLGEPVNLVWHQVTNEVANSYLSGDVQDVTGVNVISPTWFAVSDNQGNLFNIASSDYVAEAHALGMQVWGLIDNFTYDISTYDVLSHRSSRENVIRQLINSAIEVGMDGINVDFEMLSEDSGIHFLEFLRELSIECHKYNLILSVDNPVPEDFTSHYDRAEQGKIVDYVIVMGYDEHYVGSEFAGSVASLPWVEKGIQDTIEVVPAERVINGIPFYMRLWKRSAGILSSEAIGMDQAQETITANHVDVYWNTDVEQNYGEYEINGDLYQIWVEDAESIAAKVQLVPKYNLAGVAAWKLGFENSGIWSVITENI